MRQTADGRRLHGGAIIALASVITPTIEKAHAGRLCQRGLPWLGGERTGYLCFEDKSAGEERTLSHMVSARTATTTPSDTATGIL